MTLTLNQIKTFVKKYDIEIGACAFVAVVAGLAIKHPDAFLYEAPAEKIIVEVHHHHHS